MTHPDHPAQRRQFLRRGARLAAATGVLPGLATVPAMAATAATAAMTVSPAAAETALQAGPRALALAHTHTGEQLRLVYAENAAYLPGALGQLNHFLRDHYSGQVGVIDPPLFDLLHRVDQLLGTGSAFEVISGYRCAATNQRLRQRGGGGVAQRSLHMDGRAIDVRLRGVPLADLRDAALSLRAGGVGFYPRDQFVHLDTGRPRSW